MKERDEVKTGVLPDLGKLETLATGELCVDGVCAVPTPAEASTEVSGSTPAFDPDDDDSKEEESG